MVASLLVSRLATSLMLLSLILIQAHGFVPHHHHFDEASAHRHDIGHQGQPADHHWESSEQGEPQPGLEDPHPEVAPHDDLSLGSVSPSHSHQTDLAFAQPEPFVFVLTDRPVDPQQSITSAEHPYATGPPGTKSSRAPPATLTA